jgi:hypothetical protein
MSCHPPPEFALNAVAALDDFVAEIVQRAHQANVHVPSRFFDWAIGEGTRLVERLARQGLIRPECRGHGIGDWAGPWIALRFPELHPFVPFDERCKGR